MQLIIKQQTGKRWSETFKIMCSFCARTIENLIHVNSPGGSTSAKNGTGFRYYTALESVSIASALSTALTIYPCQIRVHQRWQSKLQLPTAWKKEWQPATADSSPQAVTCQHCDTHYFSRPRTRNLPIVGWLLVRRDTSSATDGTLKIKTLITHLCSQIISDSVAVEIFAIVNHARKYSAKYDVLFFETRCISHQ